MEKETIFELRKRICNGCKNDDGGGCSIIKPFNDRGETCPFSNCLIKMMCNESCLEFRDYCRH